MLDYFQVPVVVHRGEDFFAAVARGINGTEDTRNELAQAPDHYEIWLIGEVDDQGHINAKRELVFNCASFIRHGVWNRRQPGNPDNGRQPPTIQSGPDGAGRLTRAEPGPTQGPKGPTTVAAQEPNPDAGRNYPGGQSRHSER